MGCPYIPKRYLIDFLLCLGMLIIHAMRVNVAVTVVTIIDKEAHMKVGTVEAIESLPDATWDSPMIGFLHAIFYIGYLVTQLPGGYLSHHLPSHRIFGGSILVSCSLNLILPTAFNHLGYSFTCIIRALQGLSEGLLYPSCYAVMRHWTTPEERSRMGAIVLTGVYIGPVIGLMASGWMTHFIGWQYVFYTHGAVGMIWFLFWLFLSYESPATHPGISPEEYKLMQDAQGVTALKYKDDRVPWKAILTSVPVMALNICNFARSFVFFFLLTNEPTFLNVFGYSLAENGVLSALPHALMAMMAAVSGPLADHLIANPMLTSTQVRKIFTCVGWQINHLDLAPRYASVLVGITTAVGTLAGIINPLIVGVMTVDQEIAQWHRVFFLTASVLAVSVVFYFFFGSAEQQPWAEPRHKVEIVKQAGSPIDVQKPYGTFTFPAQPEIGKGDKSEKSDNQNKATDDKDKSEIQSEDKPDNQSDDTKPGTSDNVESQSEKVEDLNSKDESQ